MRIESCRCGGPVSVSIRTDKSDVIARCVHCGETRHGSSIDDAVEKWNEWAAGNDTYRELFWRLEEWYCRGWCNQDHCNTPDCPIYGLRKRAKAIDGEGE